jgi:hypothetical protein
MPVWKTIPGSLLRPLTHEGRGRPGIAYILPRLVLFWSVSVLASVTALASERERQRFDPSKAPSGQTKPAGVILGGIGCGGFELQSNGRFARATINNNWEQPVESLPGCFAAVWARAGGKSVSQALTSAPGYGLPGSSAIEFDAYFPRAVAKFTDSRLAVSVTLRAYSSIIPQDLKNSSIPAVLLVFSVKNELDAPVEASIALSWENFLGVGGTAGKGAFSDRTGNTVESLPVSGGIFGIRMSSPEKQLVDPPHRLLYNARGTYALLAAPTSPETHVTTASWNALHGAPAWWKGFAESGTVDGTSGPGAQGKVHPAGVIALRVPLREKEVLDLPFVVAWHTPRLYSLTGAEYGHYYQKSFDDAVEVGRYALDNRQSLLALLDEWQNRLLRSSLPATLSRRVMNDASVLVTNSLLTRDNGLGGAEPGPYRFALFHREGGGSAVLGDPLRGFLAQGLLLNWFPDLDLRQLGEIVSRQAPTGALPASLGDIESGFSTGDQLTTPDTAAAASFVYRVARRYRWTGDQQFLDRFYPSVKHALEYYAGTVSAAKEPIERGMKSRLAWLAACAIGRDLAAAMKDQGFERLCAKWLQQEARESAVPPGEAVQSAATAVWMVDTLGIEPPVLSSLADRLGPELRAQADSGARSSDRVLAAAFLAANPARPDALSGIDWLLRSPSSHVADEEAGIAGAAYWYALEALTGLQLDIRAGRLTLAPALPAQTKVLTSPIFAPTFWGWMEYRVGLSSARLTIRLDRVMPGRPPVPDRGSLEKDGGTQSAGSVAGLLLNEVVLPRIANRDVTEVLASVGRAPVPGAFARRPDGRLIFKFVSPLSLTVGQSLSFQIR